MLNANTGVSERPNFRPIRCTQLVMPYSFSHKSARVMATISGLPPRPFWNCQESRKTESTTCPGLAEEGCGGVVFAAMTGNLPCDKHATFTYGHVSKEFHLEFSEDNRFTCRLGKGEGSRAIEYSPQEFG